MNNTVEAIKTLIALLDGKQQLAEKILNITKEQAQTIEEKEWDNLDSLIKMKQEVIEKVDKIDQGFIKQFDAIKREFDVETIEALDVDKSFLSELKAATDRTQKVMLEIFEIEKSNNKLINKDYEEVKSKIKDINKGKKAASGYYKKAAQTDGYFIDKKK